MSASVLYDEPGPKGKALNWVVAGISLVLVLGAAWLVYHRFDQTGQWAWAKWKPFFDAPVWRTFLLPGLGGTLSAFAIGSVLALAFGFVFGIGRMSELAVVRWVCGFVVEVFRAIPLLLLMFFLYYAQSGVLHLTSTSLFWAVALGLMLYNGSVLAEIIRAGVKALPKGQREAGVAIGLSPSQVMWQILLPQAVRSMLPAIISQLVVLLKDTALGYILAYNELLNQINKVNGNFQNLIPAAIVVALIYILLNSIIGLVAQWVEGRTRRKGRTAAPVGAAEDPTIVGLQAPDASGTAV